MGRLNHVEVGTPSNSDAFSAKQARLAAMKDIGLKSAGWMIEVGAGTPGRPAA